MHCHNDWRHSDRCNDGGWGSYGGSPEFVILDFSPITNITTITQIANAFSLGGGIAAASNVAVITQ